MSLSVGGKLGPYEVLAPLGKGGMGEVYRAKDTKLDREVAIKVLPAGVAQDAERLARFEREAKALAALNHPNIAQVYGVFEFMDTESSSSRALVMELVPGQTLKGPLPLATAVNYARQIAEALEAAHEKGIVHRDLKPANILVTPADVVKVLDFGLASVESRDTGDPNNSPTLTHSPTRSGMILGTAAYMSPEQARGKPVDKRADIWAFGVVLYEMLTGKALYQGETVSDILVEVLGKEPDLSALPAHARYVVERCLRKDPRKRWQAIGDVRIALEEGLAGSDVPAPAKQTWLAWAIAGVLLVIAAGTSFVAWRATRAVSGSSDLPLMRLDADLGADALPGSAYAAAFATISPDGTRLVYAARGPEGKQMLASRLLDKAEGSVIAGTENGSGPFFSPDGQWIGFFADGKLKKIAVNGGAPLVLANISNPRGASWGDDGTIVAALTNTSGLSLIPSAGGTPQPLTQLRAGEATHRWPQMLPGGQAVLFTASTSVSNYEGASIEVVMVKTGERRILQSGGYFGRYATTSASGGHLLYVHDGVVFALPIEGASEDPSKFRPKGAPVLVLEDVASLSSSGAGQFDFSRTGILVYQKGKAGPETWLLETLNGDGSRKRRPQFSQPAAYFSPRFSPDGRHLAVALEGKGLDIYVYDLPKDALSRLTFAGVLSLDPVWTPDGSHIAFQAADSGSFSLSWVRSDGAGGVQKLLEGKKTYRVNSFTPDGRRLAYDQDGESTNRDVFTVPLDLTDPDHPKAGKPEPFAHTIANEVHPAFSPDGRWLAFASDETGVYEVYVRPFPEAGGGKWQISFAGGKVPVWSRDGKNLFFEDLDDRVQVAGYTVNGPSFVAGKPRLWSDQRLTQPTDDWNYDVAPDGQSIEALIARSAEEKTSLHATFLLNFFDELRRRTAQLK